MGSKEPLSPRHNIKIMTDAKISPDLNPPRLAGWDHSGASRIVLDGMARRFALVSAFLAPLLPLMSLPAYFFDGDPIWVMHVGIMAMFVGLGIWRERFSAPQITFVILALTTIIAFLEFGTRGVNTAALMTEGVALTLFVLCVERRFSIPVTVGIFLVGLVVILEYLAGQAGGDYSGIPLAKWSEPLMWFGCCLVIFCVAGTVLPQLVDQLEAANLGQLRERRQRLLLESGSKTEAQKLELLIRSTPVGLCVLDEKGDITLWNALSERFFGVVATDMIGVTFADYLAKITPEHPLIPRIGDLFRGQPFYNAILQSVPVGLPINLLMSGRSMTNEAGKVVGAVMTFAEVSSIIKNPVELGSLARLEDVATIANELRAPLMTQGLSLETLAVLLEQSNPDFTRVRQRLLLLEEQQARAVTLVESYYRRLRDQGAVSAVQDIFDLTSTAAESFRQDLPLGDIVFELDTHRADPAVVMAPAIWVRQVIVNLLTNAYEALAVSDGASSEAGRITLRVETTPDWLVWEVTDSSGASLPEHPEQLFRPGYTTKAVGEGRGLGLFISRATVRQLGGNLTVAQGEPGLVFRMLLPRNPRRLSDSSADKVSPQA